LIAIGSTVAGAIWAAAMVWLQGWRYKVQVSALELCLAGFCLSYLLLPLIHYLLLVPSEYRYISASTNFFAFRPTTQLLCFGVAGVLASGISRQRGYPGGEK
jgi:ABC-type Fe3+-siderophore transport system permease subunit